MTTTNKPLVFHIEKNDINPFTGKDFIAFLQAAFEKATGEKMPTSYSIKELEPLFVNDEYGKVFWTKQVAIHVLVLRLKEDYGIELHDYQKFDKNLLVVVIEDLELFKLGVRRLLDNLIDPDRKYLLYRIFIKSRMTMTFEEKLEYYKNKTAEEIARKKSSKK
ncbi:hypothetical protein [Streptococcus anginosus]|uniref:hypothetical protein n=1 Tax=Streptococcus anginosus TaxID=1328 RepID=UPI0022E355E9|nr:hypothetical protein [Streptococcus anginosus]